MIILKRLRWPSRQPLGLVGITMWLSVACIGAVSPSLGQAPPTLGELNLREALLKAQSAWQPLKADSLQRAAALGESRAHPYLEPAQLNSEWGQLNSVYRDQAIQINQVFRLPGLYAAQRNLSKVRLQGTEIEIARTRSQLERELVRTYYTYLVLKHKKQLLQHNDSLLNETVTVLQSRYQRGQLSKADLNQILLIQGESSLRVQKINRELDNSLRWFQHLTGGELFPLSQDSILWTEGLGSGLEASALPDLALLENQAREALAQSRITHQMRKPGWSMGLRNMSIQGMGPDGNHYPISRRFNTFQWGLVLPLWGRPLKEQATADRLRSEALSLDHSYAQEQWKVLQRNIRLEVTDLRNQWILYNQQLIPLANDLTNQANAQLASGELELIQWTHTLQRILQTRESHLQLAMDFNEALIRLRYPSLAP